jgi:glycosyltransferase involved in cell wall biosynthesis
MEENIFPAISIIVPSFNEEKRISRCLDSILAQTCKNIEIICVDDNSTDSTFEIIKEYSLKNSNIKAYKNPSKGVSSARNFGIEKSTGKYLGFVDSDDFIQPQMYEYLLRAITENQLDMVVCRYEKTSKFIKKDFDYICHECSCEDFIDFNNYNFVLENELIITSACTKLVKKDYLLSCGNFENFAIGEDTVLCSKLWTNTKNIFIVDAPLYCYYFNEESVSYTKIWDKKWFDLLETRFIAYENFKKYKTDKISSFYLERGMKQILSYRFNIKGTDNENIFKKPLKKFFKKYIGSYLKCKEVSTKNKLSILLFYFLPPLYSAYRKKLDNTL